MIPGEISPVKGSITLNEGREGLVINFDGASGG